MVVKTKLIPKYLIKLVCHCLIYEQLNVFKLNFQEATISGIEQDQTYAYIHDNQPTSDKNNFEQVLPPSANDCHSDQGSELSSKEMSPFPDGEQNHGKFNSDYYSLCKVGSNRSLFSGSNDGDNECDDTKEDNSKTPPHTCHKESKGDDPTCQGCVRTRNTLEFDQISAQLACLSKTVNALHQSLDSLNDSDNESSAHVEEPCELNAEGGQRSTFKDTDGYQWVEDDEFYITPSGGELIMGNSPFSDTGACCDWLNEYADDTSCNDEFEFYGNFSPSAPPSGVKDTQSSYSPIKEENDIAMTPELERKIEASIVREVAKAAKGHRSTPELQSKSQGHRLRHQRSAGSYDGKLHHDNSKVFSK